MRGQLQTLSAILVLTVAGVVQADDAGAPEKITYAKDVAPILNAHCVQCHREGEVAPMSLRTYAEVRP